MERKRNAGLPAELFHTTRMIPKRRDELLDGGSLYWVIKGSVQARQKLIDVRPFKDDEGTRRCHLVLDPALVETRPQPRRAFQGWRYLTPVDAPDDLTVHDRDSVAQISADMRQALQELCLL